MMKKLIIICAIAVLSLTVGSAQAAMSVVVDPDAFPVGTDISNAFAGLSLSAVGPGWDGTTPSNVLSINPTAFNASTGQLVFGHRGLISSHWRDNGLLQLLVDFAVVSTDVQLDFIGDNSSDFGQLLAYDAGGTLVDSAFTGQLTMNAVETLTVSGNIAYVIAGGTSSASALGLDNLQFNPIPAPGAILLGSIGAGLVGWLKRRRTI